MPDVPGETLLRRQDQQHAERSAERPDGPFGRASGNRQAGHDDDDTTLRPQQGRSVVWRWQLRRRQRGG
ncbi:MAG: hypothetical protein OHK0015_03530 [Chloroflexi bacterium OHK40]